MRTILNGIEYEFDLEVDDETCFILSGSKKELDSWVELDDTELDALQDNLAAELADEFLQRSIMRAESYYEGDR